MLNYSSISSPHDNSKNDFFKFLEVELHLNFKQILNRFSYRPPHPDIIFNSLHEKKIVEE